VPFSTSFLLNSSIRDEGCYLLSRDFLPRREVPDGGLLWVEEVGGRSEWKSMPPIWCS
jgi:hypothetical protein